MYAVISAVCLRLFTKHVDKKPIDVMGQTENGTILFLENTNVVWCFACVSHDVCDLQFNNREGRGHYKTLKYGQE